MTPVPLCLSLFLFLQMQTIIPATSKLVSVNVASFRKSRTTLNGPVRCALDQANKTVASSSLEDCSLTCTRDNTCNGFNIKNLVTCEVYNFKPKVTVFLPGCLLYQKISQDNDINCLEFGDEATSIPAQCCAVPYMVDGEVYHNCTVNTAVSNDLGCYHNNGQWVSCQQPYDYTAVYEKTSTTLLSDDLTESVPLLAINGWVLMQRMIAGGAVSFDRNWTEYRNGFGSVTGNDSYWLGLEKVYRLLQLGSIRLRVEVLRPSGEWNWAEYSTFSINDEMDKYRLWVDGYSGDASNAMAAAVYWDYNAVGRQFSTPDSDNDLCPCNCAGSKMTAWWFAYCSASVINGMYGGYNGGTWATGADIDARASRMLLKIDAMPLVGTK